MQLWETVQDSWDHDAEARITAGCIAGRIQNLSQRYFPSPDDPARLLPFLSSTPSSTNISSGPASSTTSSLAIVESVDHAAPTHNPDVVPLLASSVISYPNSCDVAISASTVDNPITSIEL